MKLPNAEKAVVEQQKVKEYLLNPAHPDGAGKAQFFMALGFESNQWEMLAAALRSIAVNSPIAESIESPHGQKHIIMGIMKTPSGRTP